MITKSQAKRKQDIKTKLMAAIAMLLVSSIMMVSSTYAWFTLSTAPEVTGITTAVGANGNLEIALLPEGGDPNTIASNVGDGVAAVTVSNRTWGNLVDLSDASYGLDTITLYPSALNVQSGLIQSTILSTPTYGSDGRVDTLTPNTSTGVYSAGGFVPSNTEVYGVRGIGTSSSMTPRQLAYRNARSSANTAMAQASIAANASLEARGDDLANIAIQYGMDKDAATYTAADIATLQGIIDDLQGTADKKGVLQYIEDAYKQYILAYAASGINNNSLPDAAYSTVQSWITNGDSLDTIVTNLTNGITVEIDGSSTTVSVTLPTEISTGINAYKTSVTNVNTAETNIPSGKTEYTWGDIRPVLTELANPAAMKINGYTASEVKENIGAIVSSVTAQGGLNVAISTGGGVYADVADQCGNYSANVNIKEVTYNGITLENMQARMNTVSTVDPSYLTETGNAVASAGAPTGESDDIQPLTDMYGYIIDLAFRTNAANSNLLLQADPIDRIYGNDNTNEETMGKGSTMSFKSADTSFTDNQVLSLMNAIKVVFFNPQNNKVICNAVLDTANATTGPDGITAELLISGGEGGYKVAENPADATHVQVVTYRAKLAGETGTHVVTNMTFKEKETDEKGTHIADGSAQYGYREATTEEINAGSATHVIDEITYGVFSGEGEATHVAVTSYRLATAEEKAEGKATHVVDSVVSIMPLTQNQAHALSVLVYLDGELVGNDDVAATAEKSMTGKLNLQFASSANLTPMEYASLHIPAQGSGNTTGG